jgi:hypothetical protein
MVTTYAATRWTGQPAGLDLVLLPVGEVAVFDVVSHELVEASDGAWRWLGWTVIQDGHLALLPAETYGLLPPLRHHPAPTRTRRPEAADLPDR